MTYKTIPLRRGFYEISEFFELCQRNDSVICGGYARYCASPLPTKRVVQPGDVDFFPKTDDTVDKLVEGLTAMGYEKRHENHVSLTMQPMEDKKGELAIHPIPQIIKPVVEGRVVTVGTVEKILDNFDFTVVRAAIISPTSVLVDEQFEEDELHKKLRLKNIHCPISSLLRCCKYAKKGYFLKPAEALRLFLDWDSREPGYRMNMTRLFERSELGRQSQNNIDGMTQEEIDELEGLLRID